MAFCLSASLQANVCLSVGLPVYLSFGLLLWPGSQRATPSICLMLCIIFHNLRGRLCICLAFALATDWLPYSCHGTHTYTHTHTVAHKTSTWCTANSATPTYIVNLSVGGFSFNFSPSFSLFHFPFSIKQIANQIDGSAFNACRIAFVAHCYAMHRLHLFWPYSSQIGSWPKR